MRDAVVLDCGSHSTKVGFAGDNLPRSIIRTVVGHDVEGSCFVGGEALIRRRYLQLSRPIRRGYIHSWEDVTTLWEGVLRNDLQVDPSDHPILLTESSEEPARLRERKTEIFFEEMGVPRFSLANGSVLSLHGYGLSSGVVVDVGEGHSAIVPVVDGKLVPGGIQELKCSGEDLTTQLLRSIHHLGFRATSPAHRDIISHVKEGLCYVAVDDIPPPKGDCYTLPDSTRLTLTTEQRSLPTSIFQGSTSNSLPSALTAVQEIVGREPGSSLFPVVLSGGTTDCSGFSQRLAQICPVRSDRSKVSGRVRSWIGGSILCSLPSFERTSVSREEYLEFGSGLVNRRCRMDDGFDDFYGLYEFSGA